MSLNFEGLGLFRVSSDMEDRESERVEKADAFLLDLVGKEVVLYFYDHTIFAGKLKLISPMFLVLEDEDGLISRHSRWEVEALEKHISDDDELMSIQRILEISTEKFISLKRYFLTDFDVSESVIDELLETASTAARAFSVADSDILHE